MEMIFVIVYWVAGYWAVGQTVYANKIVIYSGNALFVKKAAIGFCFGWILIPVAIIKNILFK